MIRIRQNPLVFFWLACRVRRAILFMILVAFLIRLAVIPFLLSDVLNPIRDHWDFGWEEGRIARSLAVGEGFSSPLFGKTGPTSWTTPIYPLLVAGGVFRACGAYTKAAARTILALYRPPRVGSPVGCFDHRGMECPKGLTCKNGSVLNGWRVLQAFGREEFLIEMLIELSLVDGQHRAGFFLYGLHLDMACAPDAGSFLERRGVKFAD